MLEAIAKELVECQVNDDRVGEVKVGEYVGDGERQIVFHAALVEDLLLAAKVAYEQDETNGQVENEKEQVGAEYSERELQALFGLATCVRVDHRG